MKIICFLLAIFLPPGRKEENALGVSQGLKRTAVSTAHVPQNAHQLLHSTNRETLEPGNQQHGKMLHPYLVSTSLVPALDFSLISFMPG